MEALADQIIEDTEFTSDERAFIREHIEENCSLLPRFQKEELFRSIIQKLEFIEQLTLEDAITQNNMNL